MTDSYECKVLKKTSTAAVLASLYPCAALATFSISESHLINTILHVIFMVAVREKKPNGSDTENNLNSWKQINFLTSD